MAFVSLIGTYFLKARGFDIAKTGWLTSLPLLGGAVGGIAGGWLNDRAIARTGSRRWGRSLVGLIGFTGAGLCVLATGFVVHAWQAVGLLCLAAAVARAVAEGIGWTW